MSWGEKNIMENIIAIFMMVGLLGCTSQPKTIIETESGRPEIIINTGNMGVVKTLLISKMGEEEWNYFLINDSAHSLTFSRQVKAEEEIDVAQLMVGTRYGTKPERIVIYNMVEIEGTIRVVAFPSLSSQNGFGKTTNVNLENNIAVFYALQELLISVKTKIEKDLTSNLMPQ
jgi:hypothetical protein